MANLPPLTLRVRKGYDQSFSLQQYARDTKVQGIIDNIVETNFLNPQESYALYSASMGNDRWLNPTKTLQQSGLNMKHTVEVKLVPHTIYLYQWTASDNYESFTFDESHPTSIGSMQIDFADPLREYMDWFQIRMKIVKDEYCFQHIYKESDDSIGVRWLNINIPLKEQKVSPNSHLLLIPLSVIAKKPLKNRDFAKEGNMTKSSIKAHKKTNTKKRYCVIQDNFLYYMGNSSQNVPSGVVPLEQYYIIGDDSTLTITLQPQEETFLALRGGVLPTYLFHCDNMKNFTEWVDEICQRCMIGAGNAVFGVPLSDLMGRKRNNRRIPEIITKTVTFIDKNASDVEGIFRISAGTADLQKYKREFDRGTFINFKDDIDPHIASGLLKLYLRELPEPLIPFKLYKDFMGINIDNAKQDINSILNLVNQIPQDNVRVLKYLSEFLARLSTHEDKTLMSLSNLALVFGPNIFRCAEASLDQMQDTTHIVQLTELIVDKHGELFKKRKNTFSGHSAVSSRRGRSSVIVDKPLDVPNFSGAMPSSAISPRGNTSGFLAVRGGGGQEVKKGWVAPKRNLKRPNCAPPKPNEDREVEKMDGNIFKPGKTHRRNISDPNLKSMIGRPTRTNDDNYSNMSKEQIIILLKSEIAKRIALEKRIAELEGKA